MHVDLLQRVDPGAEALRHPPPVAGLDHRVHVDVVEGDVAGELEPGHDHPRHPEEEDLARGGEEAGRVEGAQLGRVVGPAERGEGPDRRAEPGVEHVLLLAQLAAAGAAALGRPVLGDEGLLAGVAVPDRDPVAPPELARDAPGADLAHPVEVDPLPLAGRDPHLVALDHLDRRRRQLVHAAEPLQRDQRLDPLAGAVREGNGVGVGLLGAERRPPRAGPATTVSCASAAVRPAKRSPASSVRRPSGPITTISSSPCLRPISKSLGSWPGVIFSAPVPNSGSTCSSAMIGRRRPTSGRTQCWPTRSP